MHRLIDTHAPRSVKSFQHGWRILLCAPPPLRGAIESTRHRGSTHGVPALEKTNSTPRGLCHESGQLELVVKPSPKTSPFGPIQSRVIILPPIMCRKLRQPRASTTRQKPPTVSCRESLVNRRHAKRTTIEVSACAVGSFKCGAFQTNIGIIGARPPQVPEWDHANRNRALERLRLARNPGPTVSPEMHCRRQRRCQSRVLL